MFIKGVDWLVVVIHQKGKRFGRFVNDEYLRIFKDLHNFMLKNCYRGE